LRNKKYHFLNKAYSKKEFKDILFRLKEDQKFFDQTRSDFEQIKANFPIRSSSIENSEKSN
jgi:hypothetical protein